MLFNQVTSYLDDPLSQVYKKRCAVFLESKAFYALKQFVPFAKNFNADDLEDGGSRMTIFLEGLSQANVH